MIYPIMAAGIQVMKGVNSHIPYIFLKEGLAMTEEADLIED